MLKGIWPKKTRRERGEKGELERFALSRKRRLRGRKGHTAATRLLHCEVIRILLRFEEERGDRLGSQGEEVSRLKEEEDRRLRPTLIP